MKKDDRITIRDADLRQRVEAVIEASGGLLTLTTIVRAAIEEKLSSMEQSGEIRIPLPRSRPARRQSPKKRPRTRG